MQQFLKLPADVLLDKFGSGGHAPGSGSAAALLGLIAANLVYTVGQLTLGKEIYKEQHQAVKVVCTRIQTVLVPTLTELFQRDAEEFDLVFNARVARNAATDKFEKKKLALAALEQQKLATATPIKIAEACLELIDLSVIVFDAGYRAARGDTGVALSSAVAGVLSAVFVINLNLIPFRRNYWARQRRKECDQLQQVAVDKYQAAIVRVNQLRSEDVDTVEADENGDAIAKLLSGAKNSYTDSEIDERASDLRALVWKNRTELRAGSMVPSDEDLLLAPEIALNLLGYKYSLVESLGTISSDSRTFEVAGLLEALPGSVNVSRKMTPEVRLFTTAHELGHIILHPQLREAHRDRPLDGSAISRTQIEREADRFASSYLMPAKLVREKFSAMFGTQEFYLSEGTAYALLGVGLDDGRRRMKSKRLLSHMLANTERFNGKQIISLANQFKVSATAMAIRLEELKLLRFDA